MNSIQDTGWRDDQDFEPHPNSARAYLRHQHKIKYLKCRLRGVYMGCGIRALKWVTPFLMWEGIVVSVFRDRLTNSEEIRIPSRGNSSCKGIEV